MRMPIPDAIEQIRRRLQCYPSLTYHDDGHTITVDPTSNSGFSVSLTVTADDFIVCFDGWHEHFDSQVEAINYFVLGLSEQFRLKVFRRGKTDYRWTLEYRTKGGEDSTQGGWEEDSTTGRLFFPFWRSREISYRQNSLN